MIGLVLVGAARLDDVGVGDVRRERLAALRDDLRLTLAGHLDVKALATQLADGDHGFTFRSGIDDLAGLDIRADGFRRLGNLGRSGGGDHGENGNCCCESDLFHLIILP